MKKNNKKNQKHTNYAKLDKARKIRYLPLSELWLLAPKNSFWSGEWTLPFVSTQFWGILLVSQFPKILIFKLSGKSWGNLYTKVTIY